MEEKQELKNKMEQFLNDVEQMKNSIGGKNAEIEMFEDELGKLEGEKKTLEVYSYNEPELAEEKQEEIEKTEKQIEELYEQLGKYKELKVNFKGSQVKEEPEQKEPQKEEKAEVEQKEPEKEEKTEAEPKIINENKKREENIQKAGTISQNEISEPNEKAIKKVSKWDKFKENCKKVWSNVKKKFAKVALALGVATSAVGPAVIENKTEVDKTEEKTVTHKEAREVPVNVGELQVGDEITVDGDLTYYYTSDMDQPVGITGNRTENGDNLDVIITYTMPGNNAPIHISLNPNGNENLDLDVDGNSDLGWVMSNELQNHVLDKVEEYEVTENVEIKTTKTENTFNPVVRTDAKAVGETASQKATREAEAIAGININKSTEPKDKPASKVTSTRDKFKENLRVDNADRIDKLLEQYDTKALEEKMEKFKMSRENKNNDSKEKDREEER